VDRLTAMQPVASLLLGSIIYIEAEKEEGIWKQRIEIQ